ncbi:hypothetical protein VTK26DRAFT_3644 [Humicola hyalothermophila]
MDLSARWSGNHEEAGKKEDEWRFQRQPERSQGSVKTTHPDRHAGKTPCRRLGQKLFSKLWDPWRRLRYDTGRVGVEPVPERITQSTSHRRRLTCGKECSAKYVTQSCVADGRSATEEAADRATCQEVQWAHHTPSHLLFARDDTGSRSFQAHRPPPFRSSGTQRIGGRTEHNASMRSGPLSWLANLFRRRARCVRPADPAKTATLCRLMHESPCFFCFLAWTSSSCELCCRVFCGPNPLVCLELTDFFLPPPPNLRSAECSLTDAQPNIRAQVH